MTRLSRLIPLLAVFILPTLPSPSQDFDDIFDSADDEFKKLKQQTDSEFSQMKASVDEEFGELLENAWKEFELASGLVRDTTPKPKQPPVAKTPAKPEPKPAPEPEPEPQPETTPVPETPSQPEPAPVPKPAPAPKPVEKPSETPAPPLPADRIAIKFYGTEITLKYDRLWKRATPLNRVSPEAIKSSWDYFSKTDYSPFLEQANYVKSAMALNDWGYCRLLNTVSYYLYPDESNRRPVFVWFMLVHSGFDARIGYLDDQIFVMIPSPQTVYAAPFYEFDNRKYYITGLGGSIYGSEAKSLYSYEGRHEEASKAIDFSFAEIPKVGRKETTKHLNFEYERAQYDLDVALNETMMEFMNSYPQVDLDVYFGAPVSTDTARTLIEGLKPVIDGKDEKIAANMLLRFVQTSLKYQTDDEQFQYENYLFPEESLYYPYCDCEDRSFLYGFLVRELLGLEVVGLQFPGHVATAVKFSSAVPGDSITVGGSNYTICDPTYINADIGMCMPQFLDVKPVIIKGI